MANGKRTLTGSISSGQTLTGSVKGGSGTTDHSRLTNRANEDQHPIESITGLREELNGKLDSNTALPLINQALKGKAKGLYFDALRELARKPYWYLTAEIDPDTGLGTKNSIISGPYDLGMGGGSGGGGGVTSVAVTQLDWPVVASVGNEDVQTKIKVSWSSVIGEDRKPTGSGTMYLIINGRQVETKAKQAQGEVEFDIGRYLVSGDNNVQVKVLDMYGTTGITVGIINGVALKLTSNFDSSAAFYDKIDYTYTPVGNVEKKVYFIVDEDVENAAVQTVKSSNELITYTLRGLSHGAHTLRVYFEANVGGEWIPSNELFYDLTFVQAGNKTPIIASDFNKFKQEQYIGFTIPYRVFIDGRNMATVVLKADGETIRTSDVTTNGVHIWAYRIDEPTLEIADNGETTRLRAPVVLEIICGTTTKRFEIDTLASKVTVTPVTENLELALSATGRSNEEYAEEREIWSYTNILDSENPITYSSVFHNFNWSSDGWVLDEKNINVLRVGGAARVEIPFEVFAKNFHTRGKTIELEIATRGIRNYDTTIISCLDKEESPFYSVEEFFENEDSRLEGFEVSYVYSTLVSAITTQGRHTFQYDGTSWTLNNRTINLDDYGIKLTKAVLNAEGEDLGTVIKGDRIIVTYSMEARGFKVTPQVASIRSQQSLLSTQYKEDEHIRIAFVVEPNTADKNRIIWMYINGVASGAMQYPSDDTFEQISPSYITIGSSDAIVDIYNIRIYDSALTNKQIVNNWIADTADAVDKAYRFNHNNVLTEQDTLTPESLLIGAADLPYIIWGIDPLPQSKVDVRPGTANYVDPTDSTRNFTAIDAEYKVQGTSSAVYPTKNIRLRTKVGKGGPNLEWYDEDGNDLLIKNGGKGFAITNPNGIGVDYFTFKVDYASSEGANNVELTKLYNDASKTYGILTPPQQQDSRVRVGIDGFPIAAFQRDKNENLVFVTKANFNNDKGNPEVYGFEDGDESWETTNNSAAETKYQKPVTVENFAKGFEIRFPDKDGYNNMSKLGPMTEWVYSTYRYPGLPKEAEKDKAQPLPQPVTFKYGESTPAEDGSFTTTDTEATFTHDTQEYRLTKFKAELKDWFNVDSCLFYYLFTELFLMIDSRAKNAFPTYYKSRKAGDGGDRWFWIPYDMDTAIGIDNKGKLTFDYYLEDTDQLYGADVYNGQSSVMWCNVRDAFKSELAAMYLKLRNQGLLDYEEVERRFSEHQNKWPEVLLNLDAHNKYIVPLKNGDNYLEMLQGTKEQQRKWWLYNRFKYIDSKYNAGDAKADFIQFRAYVDKGEVKPDLVITPYANIYATASFGNGAEYLVSERVVDRGKSVTLYNPFGLEDDENDQETYIYSASQLKSIGDISGFHPDTVKIGNAIRLQELKVGDKGTPDSKYPGYKNPYLKELTVGANTLLRTLDARNCVNLGTGTTVVPDLRECTNIEEIYFTGTKIKGVDLPDGGTIRKLHLPGTLTNLTIKNQPLLTDLFIENTNTTITKSASKTGGYIFRGLVVKKEAWNTTNANANLYLANSEDPSDPRIRVSIANKELYETIVAGESKLSVSCDCIDARFDLIEDTTIELAEYATRFINEVKLESGQSNVTLLIAEITDAITPPDLIEFKTSLIETLWLEGIPSSVIHAKDFIKNMKPGTKVRLININETYEDYEKEDGTIVEAWEQVKEFYDLLDRHYGINFNDSPVLEKAQVTGIINIDKISYMNYITLSARYPDVTIIAKQIISTVAFYNEGRLYSTTNVPLNTTFDPVTKLTIVGEKIHAPTDPTKEFTQSHYYDFEHWVAKKATLTGYEPDSEIWTADYLVTADTRLDAVYSEHLQRYLVEFDTDSNIIEVDDAFKNLEVEFGSTIEEPPVIWLTDPDTTDDQVLPQVTLHRWYNVNTGDTWYFKPALNASIVEWPTKLKAEWIDAVNPKITQVDRVSYNTFSYVAEDNLGITKWAVVKDSAEPPTQWEVCPAATTHLEGIYTIESAGTYYFWVSDANGTTASSNIVAHAISVETTPGITEDHYYFTENGQTVKTDFALNGTRLTLTASTDDHYENLNCVISTAIGNSLTFAVSEPVNISLTCTPKTYRVSFNLQGRTDEQGTNYVPDQGIIYNHPVLKPLDQYWPATNEIIKGWYLDKDCTEPWSFETDLVDRDLTLYANWQIERKPSTLTVQIPDGDKEARTIILSYSQYNTDENHRVVIEWGDGQSFVSADNGTVLHVEHTYDTSGTYEIVIFGPCGGIENQEAYYALGDGYGIPLIMPSQYLIKVDFAWDIPSLAPYALSGTNITRTGLTSYMNKVPTGCYFECKNLEQIDLPESIIEIHDQAFYYCTNATGPVKIPRAIKYIGHNAFDHCEKITGFELVCVTPNPELYTRICANCSSLKYITLSEHIAIPEQMFAGCGLEEVVLTNSFIGNSAFTDCFNLRKVLLSNPDTYIAPKAFAGCRQLTEVDTAARYLGMQAFDSCTNLETVVLRNKNLIVEGHVFNRCSKLREIGPLQHSTDDNYMYDLNYAWEEEIPDYAFQRDNDSRAEIIQVVVPAGIKSIGKQAFDNAAGISSLELPESLKHIGEGAFTGCIGLMELTIPSGVETIGAKACLGCFGLKEVFIQTTSVTPKVDVPENGWFFGTDQNLKLYIPSSINTSFDTVALCYGPHWNAYKQRVDGGWEYLSYSSYTEPTIE